MEVRFVRMRENVKLPEKKHINDAGYDLAWAPLEDEIRLIEKIINGKVEYTQGCTIDPGQSVLLKTGLKALFSDGYMMEVKNRSGVAAKKGLLVGACVVDSTYRGEIFVNLHNVSNSTQWIEPGDRVAQVILSCVETITALEITKEEYVNYETTRGAGALGSTGV